MRDYKEFGALLQPRAVRWAREGRGIWGKWVEQSKTQHFSDLELQSELWFGVGHLIVSRMLSELSRWALFSSAAVLTLQRCSNGSL